MTRLERTPGGTKTWTWFICGILFLGTVNAYLDRQTMSLLSPLICGEFKLNNEQWGELLSAFRWTYAFAQIPAGYLADRFSVRVVFAVAVGVWSLGSAGGAFAIGPRTLAWTRRVLGLGEAFQWPCSLRVTANMLPPEDRGLANGFFTSGAATGSLLAPFIILPLASLFGWRVAFFAIGSIGFFWIALWWVATGRPETLRPVDKDQASPAVKRQSLARQTAFILRQPGFWLLMIVACSINPCTYFIAEWIPKYMHDQRGFGILAAGFISTPIFLSMDIGNIGGGGLVKYLAARGMTLRRARGATVIAASLLVLPAALASHVDNPYVCIGLLVVAMFGIAAIGANYLAALQEVSFQSVGLVAGLLGTVSNIFAATANPWIGSYVDETGDFHLVFVALALLPMVGLAALLTFDAVVARRDT